MSDKVVGLIEKGFIYLKRDCTHVSLDGFIDKNDIPKELTREEFNEGFDHEYQDTKSDGFDDGSFFGYIYLPFIDDKYMMFSVCS